MATDLRGQDAGSGHRFKRTVRPVELRRIASLADTIESALEQDGRFPHPSCGDAICAWNLAGVEAWAPAEFSPVRRAAWGAAALPGTVEERHLVGKLGRPPAFHIRIHVRT